jgi:mannose-1-phosphate guanylyltransferase
MDHTYAVIMAGGGGTRLWPISRRKHPKHVLPLLGARTLFQGTLDRLDGFIPPERVFIVTTAEQVMELKPQAPGVPDKNFIIEPMPRGTASVIGLAAEVLAKIDPQAVMLALPADHFIRNRDLFLQTMRVAIRVAHKGYLVTLGITPTYPSTGYGYIQQGVALSEDFDFPVFHVIHFIEKPDMVRAGAMVASGDHSWNSGMFIWRVSDILKEFSRQMPDLSSALSLIGAAWGRPEQEAVLNSAWPHIKSETIDYGIMEGAARVAVVPAGGLEWSDVGSWDSLFEVIPPDANGNVVVNGELVTIESHNSLVYAPGRKLIVTIGVDDLIVIDAGDALLVCHRNQSQQVRQVIATLKKSHQEEYL